MNDPQIRYLAPGSCVYDSVMLPGTSQSRNPGLDEHIVEPETREEMIDGRLVYASPAKPPHGDRHSELDYVLRANAADAYVTSADMLTRFSDRDNFATDVSIRKKTSPGDASRALEELAVEVKHTQRMTDLTKRARKLVARGVRRVFVICVGAETSDEVHTGRVLEWSRDRDDWIALDEQSYIEDPCLGQPVKVHALLDAAEADNSVAQALIRKRNPIIVQREADTYDQGQADGYRRGLCESIFDLYRALKLPLPPTQRARISTMTLAELDELRASLLPEGM